MVNNNFRGEMRVQNARGLLLLQGELKRLVWACLRPRIVVGNFFVVVDKEGHDVYLYTLPS